MAYKQTAFGTANFAGEPKMGFSNMSKQNPFYGTQHLREESQLHHLSEVDNILQGERNKFRDIKARMESDLEGERRVRLQFENKLIKLKDEFSRKDLEMSEVEFKYNAIVHQNQDLQLENERLKSQLQRLQDIYGGKIHALQTQLSMDGKSFQDTTAHYARELEKFKREGQEYVETLNFEYERKVKSLEDRLKASESSRKDLGMDNKRLNDLLNNNKMSYEQELRDTVSRIREEQNKKYVFLSKSSEQKMKMTQDAQQLLNKKNLSLLKAIQEKQRQMQELQNGYNVQAAKLTQQIADLASKNNQLSFMMDKLRNDLNAKNALIDRSVGESGQQAVYLKQQLQQKRQQIDILNQTLAQMQQRVMNVNAEAQRRRQQVMERQRLLQAQCQKHKEKYEKLCAMLSNKINETITHVSYNRP